MAQGRRAARRPAAAGRPGRAALDPARHSPGSAAAATLRRAGHPAGLLRRPRPALPPAAALRRPARDAARSATSSGRRTGRSCRRGSASRDVRVEPTFRRRVQRTIALLEDETGTIDATWFGRRYIERRLQAGGEVVVSGKVKRFGRTLTFDNPEFQAVARRTPRCCTPGGSCRSTALTAGLTAARLRTRDPRGARPGGRRLPRVPAGRPSARRRACADRRGARGGPLPGDVRGARRRAPAARVRRAARAPARAWSRGAGSGPGPRRTRRSPSTTPTTARSGPRSTEALAGRVGRAVELTADQATAIDGDPRPTSPRPTPMLRLLQGDVGSGKTAVAAWALAAAALAGRQAALLAPTDLLARQHHATRRRPARGRSGSASRC